MSVRSKHGPYSGWVGYETFFFTSLPVFPAAEACTCGCLMLVKYEVFDRGAWNIQGQGCAAGVSEPSSHTLSYMLSCQTSVSVFRCTNKINQEGSIWEQYLKTRPSPRTWRRERRKGADPCIYRDVRDCSKYHPYHLPTSPGRNYEAHLGKYPDLVPPHFISDNRILSRSMYCC